MEIDWLLAKVFRTYRMLRALQRDLLNRSNEPLDRTIDNPQRQMGGLKNSNLFYSM